MKKIKPMLPLICAMVFAIALFIVDATAYKNEANEVDVNKAFLVFAALWPSFNAFFKANPNAAE